MVGNFRLAALVYIAECQRLRPSTSNLAMEIAMLGSVLIPVFVVIASLFGSVLLEPCDGEPTVSDFSPGWLSRDRK